MYIAKVKRPTFEEENKTVTLTAKITSGTVTKEKDIVLTVKKKGVTDSQAVVVDLASLNIPSIIKGNIELTTSGLNGSVITWKSSDEAVINKKGIVQRPSVGSLAKSITLTATSTKGVSSENKTFTVSVEPWTLQEEFDDAISKLTWDFVKKSNTNKSDIKSDLNLPATVGRGIKATWETSNDTYCTTAGKITRPPYSTGPIALVLTVNLEHGDVGSELTQTVIISGLTIAALPMTNAEIANKARSLLNESLFIGTNESLVKITDDMILPVTINDPECSKAIIKWSLVETNHSTQVVSSKFIELTETAQNTQCTVTRPTNTDGNISLSLCATINVGSDLDLVQEKKYFDITITALAS